MKKPHNGSRACRGRLMLVGGAGGPGGAMEWEAVRKQLHSPPIEVANIFEAIGALSQATPAHPIAAVVLDERALPTNKFAASEALRKVDPSVQVVRITEGKSVDGHHAKESDADALLQPPLRLTDLRSAIGAEYFLDEETDFEVIRSSALPNVPNGKATDAAVDISEPPRASEETPAAMLDDDPIAGTNLESNIHTETARGAGANANEVSIGDDVGQTLGDVDLVDAILANDDALKDQALELIRQHTGWRDLSVIGPDDMPPADAVQSAVQIGGTIVGKLIARRISRQELLPWARWLERWMALDDEVRRLRMHSYRDDLTGAWNRRYFNDFLTRTIADARERRRPISLMVFDIDDFKVYNDRFGHEAGDVILCETVALLSSVIRECDRVCRIGGDEFAVVFADLDAPRAAGSNHPDSVEEIVLRFQAQVCTMRFPKLGIEAPGILTISAGLSTFPWDGDTPADLLRLADCRALESKRKGKNAITFGPGVSKKVDYSTSQQANKSIS